MKKKDNIWLIGGHSGQLYTDNAKVFHQYILNTYPKIDIYWIVSKNAPVYSQIAGKKLLKGSIKSYLYFYQAKVVLFSDTLNSDIAPFSFVLPFVKIFYSRTFKVYLSHGTIAFKKMPTYKGKMAEIKKNIFSSYNLAIASTYLAREAMIGYNIHPDNIVIKGSARHDELKTLKSDNHTILIAPTWRPWITNKEQFTSSDFYHHYTTLLSDKKLLDYLHTNNIIIYFYLHHMFHKYIDTFKKLNNNHIQILSSEIDISKKIKSSHLMITDYSSMCSDFYYLNKPVLFFQFDREKFIDEVGSEIDLKNTTYGDVSFESQTLINTLLHTIENNYPLSPQQKEGEKYFIHFKDTKNCQRIYNVIINRLSL